MIERWLRSVAFIGLCVSSHATNCATYVCPTGFIYKGSPAGIPCACCGGACPCVAGLCDAGAANNAQCCDGNKCTGGPGAGADPNVNDNYATCTTATAKSGDTCVPSCAFGYTLNPPAGFTLVCQSPSAQFDASGATCDAAPCAVANSDLIAGSCKCLAGFRQVANAAVAGVFKYDCTANTCIQATQSGTADPNANPGNGYLPCVGQVTGNNCAYNCAPGFANPGLTLICDAGGNIDASATRCVAEICTNIPAAGVAVQNYAPCQNLKSGDVCTPTCNVGFVATAPFSLVCVSANMPSFVAVDTACTTAPCPAFSAGATCACDAGYTGTPAWSVPMQAWTHTCTPIPCAPAVIANVVANVDYSDCLAKSTGQECTLRCAVGFVANGATTAKLTPTCLPNFDGTTALACVAAPCPVNAAQAATTLAPAATCGGCGTFILEGGLEVFSQALGKWTHKCIASCASYTCPTGYADVASPATTSCLSVDTSACTTALCCSARTCGPAPLAANVDAQGVYTNCNGLVTGIVCTMQCNTGFTPSIPTVSLVCDAAGTYATPMVCNANTCTMGPSLNEDPAAIYTTCNMQVTGSMCTPTCPAGYTQVGGAFAMLCNANQYNAAGVTCTKNTCTAPITPDPNADAGNGYVACTGLVTGQQCTPQCRIGFVLTGGTALSLVCTPTYDVTSLTCVKFGCPVNSIDAVTPGVCTCETGFTGVLVWTGAAWSGTCLPQACAASEVLNSIEYSAVGSLTGNTNDEKQVTCRPGFKGTKGKATCLPDGTWDRPSCDAQNCVPDYGVTNSVLYHTPDSIVGVAEAVVAVTCNPGFVCSQLPCQTVCQGATLSWSTLTCNAVACPAHASIEGTCNCDAGYIAQPAVAYDSVLNVWTHTCWASCGWHTCTSPLYRLHNAPATLKCPTADVSSCNDMTCCVGLIVTPSFSDGTKLQTTEGGGTGTFTVVLVGPPANDVVVDVTSQDATEGFVTPAKLTFTTALWNVAQTVTVRGLNDDLDDGDIAYIVRLTLSGDAEYSTIVPHDVQCVNADDDATDIKVSLLPALATELIVEESNIASKPQFTVELMSEPTANVVITVLSSDATEGIIALGAGAATPGAVVVTFTPATWNVKQTITVTGVDEQVDDGDVTFTIQLSPATSMDMKYNGINPADVSVRCIDDDTRGVLVEKLVSVTNEAAGAGLGTFRIRLLSEPTLAVSTLIESSDLTEGTVSPQMLSFGPTNWATPQTVTVTGRDDLIDDGDIVYTITTSAFSSSDPMYVGLNPDDVIMTNIDDDTAGVVSTPTAGLLVQETGGTATFTVVLSSEPTHDVTIEPVSRDLTEGTTAPQFLVFTAGLAGNWNVPQTVTVTGLDDYIDDDDVAFNVTLVVISTDGVYDGIRTDEIQLSNADNDTALIVVDPTSGLMTSEVGGTDTFTIVLGSQPVKEVVISLSSSDFSEGTMMPRKVTFTESNWRTPITVTVTGVDDFIADGNVTYTIVTDAAVSLDPKYNGKTASDVGALNIDNDRADVFVSPTNGLITSEKGVNAEFEVYLTSQPLSDVTIAIASDDLTEGTLDPSLTQLVFTNTSWNVPQRIVVFGQDDDLRDEDVAYSINLEASVSGDASYNGKNRVVVSLTNLDDDTPGILIFPNETIITKELGSPTAGCTSSCGNDKFQVALFSQPQAGTKVVLKVEVSDDTEAGVLQGALLEFDPTNWNTRQDVEINGLPDNIDDGDIDYTVTISVVLDGLNPTSDTNYRTGLPPGGIVLPAINIDEDTAGITIQPQTTLVTSESGATAEFTVQLDTKPVTSVSVKLGADETEGMLAGPNTMGNGLSLLTLLFTDANWNVPQTVIVTGADDFIDDGDVQYRIAIGPITSQDAPYNGFIADGPFVNNTDNDVAGVNVTLSMNVGPNNELITHEYEDVNWFDVVLNTQPTHPVTIWATSSDITEGTVSPGSLTFMPSEWNVTQRVRLTGVADNIDEGNEATGAGDIHYTIQLGPVISADPQYSVINPDDLKAVNKDNDEAGIFVSGKGELTQTSEDGTTVEYTIALKSEPTSDVTLTFESGNTAEGTVSPSFITFVPAQWGNPQTITITGVDDFIDDGPVRYSISVPSPSTNDEIYAMQRITPLNIENKDNDVSGFTVSPLSGLSVTEAGTNTTFTVVLNTQPLPGSLVHFTIASQNTEELSVQPDRLTFTDKDDSWRTPQTVTVTGVPDLTVEKTDPIVAVRVATGEVTTNTAYGTLPYVDVNITNIDIDKPGIQIIGTTLITEESAGAAGAKKFTVKLNSKPADGKDVTINVRSDDTTEGVIDLATVVLSATLMEKEVTVTPQADMIDDGNVVYHIITEASTSGDPDYNRINPLDVTVTNVDDDTAGIFIQYPSAAQGRYETSESGGTATFEVKLLSQPVNEVIILVKTTDASEGRVDPLGAVDGILRLQFQSGDWDTAQTVTVTGQDDDVDDGDIDYRITFDVSSADAVYNVLRPASMLMRNIDDDVRGVLVSETTLTTAEDGSWGSFEVALQTRPTAPVQIDLRSSDPSEGRVLPTSLIFSETNWDTRQVVNVTGIDDFLADGNIAYTVYLNTIVSNDLVYHGFNPDDVSCENTDNDFAGVRVRPTRGGCHVVSGTHIGKPCIFPFVHQGQTYTSCVSDTLNSRTWCSTEVDFADNHIIGSEGTCAASCTGGLTTTEGASLSQDITTTAEFLMRLTSIPSADVSIELKSDDLTEGTVSPMLLVFSPLAWDTPQTVTVTAVDDTIADGDQLYTILTSPCVSRDAQYNSLVNPPDLLVNNTDDDIPGITVSENRFLTTKEDGTTATFTVWLTSQPQAGVSLTLNVTDATEGSVSPDYILFTSATWNVRQTITVTGVADNILDGDQTYYINIDGVLSTDERYKYVNPVDVRVVNEDVFDECIDSGITCMAVGQVCRDTDTNPERLGDWECACSGDATGSARAGIAVCSYNGECQDNHMTCTTQSQVCRDLGAGMNNWQCECPSPSIGNAVIGAVADCRLDECLINGALCAAVGQTCEDPNTSFGSLRDWKCVCPPPQAGSMVGGVATCEWSGECRSRFSICTSQNQTCYDTNTTLAGDWECVCLLGVGRSAGQAAVCLLDECIVNSKVCTDKDQVCRDPNHSPDVRGDWICECIGSDAVGTGSSMPATCLVDECAKLANRDACLNYGQVCVDPNKAPASLRDWYCECVLPAVGKQVMAAATCTWPGECALAANRNVCINPNGGIIGQTCHDPNPIPQSQGDWQCVCVSPQDGKATRGPAICSHDECIEFGQVCRNYGQTCMDPNPTPSQLNDWTCNCESPATGAAKLRPAPCSFVGECITYSGVCTTHGQTCNDPDISVTGDWECKCIGDAGGVGTKVGGYSTECELNECLQYGHICKALDQVCVDRNMNTTSTGDWGCQCNGGPEKGFTLRGVAQCILDECLGAGQVCNNNGQKCVDQNTDVHMVGDWMCICQGSSSGQAVAKLATCDYTPECEEKMRTQCRDQGMTCTDPQILVPGDAKCTCVYPRQSKISMGSGGTPTADEICELDECVLYGRVCLEAGQTCVDLNKGVGNTDDWICQCYNGLGTGNQKPAVCVYTDECEQRHTICSRVGQACYDTDPKVPNDWGCICPTDQFGKKSGGVVDDCRADECNGNLACAEQRCEDPNTSPLSLLDWKCVCTGSNLAGEAVATKAVCVLDECLINAPVCAAKGQLCKDPNTGPTTTNQNDWRCECVEPETRGGFRVGNVADCTFVGECLTNFATCQDVGQVCNDPDPVGQTGDWECVCVGKLTGRSTGSPASCRLDECVDNGKVCNAVGQICVDPDTTALSQGNWECRCVAPSQGRQQGAPAKCNHVGECIANAVTCSAKGQACRDPDLARVGDWECVCIGDQQGRRTGAPASCVHDECIANSDVCRRVGQTCRDPSPLPESLNDWACHCVGLSAGGISERGGVATCQWQGECSSDANSRTCTSLGQTCTDPSTSIVGDWRCECVWPEVGSRQAKQAPCVLDECLTDGLICARSGQSCKDPNVNPLSLNDWMCSCVGSSTGQAVAALAMCEFSGECVANGGVCTAAGQYCRDRSSTKINDWECICVAPFTGGAPLGAAVCTYDECQVYGSVCQAAGQRCVDNSTLQLNDWKCECVESVAIDNPPVFGQVARCRYNGECEANSVHGICTAAGQTCVDAGDAVFNNWECRCVHPMDGSATGKPATCILNECNTNADICTSVGQKCVDPNHGVDSTDDWTCECSGSDESGSAIGKAATCTLDECSLQVNWAVCAGAGQLCVDPDTDPISRQDWECRCGGSGSGSAVAKRAECTYTGECQTAQQTCSSAGQICVDKDSLEGNWECMCVPPYTGSARSSVASCEYDECVAKGKATCENAKQRCRDRNTNPSSRDDWVCECLEPMTGVATAGAATCSFVGECLANAVKCTEKGQTCTDPDTSIIGDWACLCVAPQSGQNSTAGPANCVLDECLQFGSTCTSRGQKCVDPDLDPLSTDDWFCKCVAPGKGQARGIAVARCEYLSPDGGECVTYAPQCAAAGQACNDPDVTRQGDWECICVPPTIGRGVASTTACTLDECIEYSFACTAAGQLCVDPNKSPSAVGDWTCECQGSGSGTGLRTVAACSWTGECAVSHSRCVLAGQTCVDPNPDPSVTGDWRCDCVSPHVGTATAQVAQCTFDECSVHGSSCVFAGQDCFDPDTSINSMGDWLCRCRRPSSGSSVASVAVCVLDECGYGGSDLGSDGFTNCPTCAANRNQCRQSGQTCQDPDTTRTGDWECVCPPPQIGRAKGKVASCEFDECLRNAGTCTSRGQLCIDPVKTISSTNDWQCHCTGSATDSFVVGAPAVCTYREDDDCLLSANTCTVAMQACQDPTPGVVGGWKCLCVGEQTGEATGMAARCILDECRIHGNICTAEGQVCLDPDTSTSSTGDWACRCSGDAVGVARTRAATCVLDECVKYGATCQQAGQMCKDPNQSPLSTGDWTCKCDGSSSGSGRAMVATCAYAGECAEHSYICTSVGQTCFDPDTTRTGDWVCKCVEPATGSPSNRQAAVCTFDECKRVSSICSNRGQACDDPRKSPTSLNDWTCKCMGSGTGTQVAGPATCEYTGACQTFGSRCLQAGQSCAESSSGGGAWECACAAPASGTASENVASCTLNECDDNTVCAAASQKCVDPNTDLTSLNDWKCECTGDERVGWAVGKAAKCVVDECVTNLNVCSSKGQICFDPNTDALARNDWTCTCMGSGQSTPKSAIATAANCVYSGECNANSQVCVDAGQTCIDPDQREVSKDDWLCSCVPPARGSKVGGAATCELDECILNGSVCTDAGQTCVDRDTASNSLDNWECHCIGTSDANLRAVAQCNYQGECRNRENSDSCTAVGQTCFDPNVDWLGDWQCRCVDPEHGSPSPVGAAQCIHDECKGNSQAFIICASAGQSCVDPDISTESRNDWKCTCAGSSVGDAVGTIADCPFVGECQRFSGICTSAGQTCVDPDPTKAGDWSCKCVAPATGDALGKTAKCILDECGFNKHKCGINQDCRDPDDSPTSLGDWQCVCKVGTGTLTAGPAVCIFNECDDEKNSKTCTDVGQTCSDPVPSIDVKGDWRCNCVASGSGWAVARPMRTCVYEGECQTQAAACSAVGQACFDPNTDVADDWQCLCVYPLKGIAATGGIAQCVLDECAAGTSGQSICAAAGQVCTDSQPYANSTNDWTCNCVNPPSSMLTRPAECNWQNECVNNHKVCTDAGQTCTDETSNIMGDWKCECVSPSSGSAIAQKAQCDVNECTTQTVCTDVGQICNDPDLKTSGDWRCSCQGDSKGSALRKPAQCGYTTTACEKNHAVCESNGQFCETKNNIEFTCKCLPPLLGSQVGAPAGCYEPFGDECAADRPNAKVCTDQGQACVDPNQDVSADWECRCTNGANKKARRAPVPSCDDSTPAPVVVSSLKFAFDTTKTGFSEAEIRSAVDSIFRANALTTTVTASITGSRVVLSVSGSSSTPIPQLAEQYRSLLEADRTFFARNQHVVSNVVTGDCAIPTGSKCGTGQRCADTDGEVSSQFVCLCPAPQHGKILNAAAVCKSECTTGATCQSASSKLSVTLKVPFQDLTTTRKNLLETTMAEALGVPRSALTGFLYTAVTGGTKVDFTIARKLDSESDTSLQSTMLSAGNGDITDNNGNGFLKMRGFPTADQFVPFGTATKSFVIKMSFETHNGVEGTPPMSTLIKRVLVNGGYTSAEPKNVQFNGAAGGGGARVIFEVEQTSSTDIAQLAEKYRLLFVNDATIMSAASHAAMRVYVGDCVDATQYKCDDLPQNTLTYVCHDTDGAVNNKYVCPCPSGFMGKGLSQKATCETECTVGTSNPACQRTTAKLAMTVQLPPEDMEKKREDYKRTLSKALGVSPDSISGLKFEAHPDGTRALFNVTRAKEGENEQMLQEAMINAANADLQENNGKGFFSLGGFPVSGNVQSAAGVQAAPDNEDDECFLKWSGLSDAWCGAILGLIILFALLIVAVLLKMCKGGKKQDAYQPQTDMHNEQKHPQVDENPASPSQEVGSPNADYVQQSEAFGDVYPENEVGKEEGLLTPSRGYGESPPQQQEMEVLTGSPDYGDAPVNFNEATAYTSGRGRTFAPAQEGIGGSPQFSRGRGQSTQFLSMVETEAPGTSGWV
eukprot:Rhum_TRINITY_DN15180_c2_g1::Rhum_TRINITY_DN15180_c2_g1_i1::g.138378::m.138378